jgi:DNA-binding response OmpR family regulator
MRVLVIDDTHHVRAAIKSALEANGYGVVAVENGPLGLRAFGQAVFNVAIIDIFMPDMDGITLVKELRRRSPHLPIVVISGGTYGAVTIEILTTTSGFSGLAYLQKPFRPDQLIAAMNEAVRAAA